MDSSNLHSTMQEIQSKLFATSLINRTLMFPFFDSLRFQLLPPTVSFNVSFRFVSFGHQRLCTFIFLLLSSSFVFFSRSQSCSFHSSMSHFVLSCHRSFFSFSLPSSSPSVRTLFRFLISKFSFRLTHKKPPLISFKFDSLIMQF